MSMSKASSRNASGGAVLKRIDMMELIQDEAAMPDFTRRVA
jgi:hypothetical protein